MERLYGIVVISVLTLAVVRAETCDSGFETVSNAHLIGATKFPEVTTLEECKTLCLDQDSCVAVDWNFGAMPYQGSHCWLHFALEGNTRNNRIVHHLRKCQLPECTMTYNHFEGAVEIDASEYPDAENQQECRDACTEDIMCRGFAVSTSGEFMCLLRRWVEEDIEEKDDVDHYVRVPCPEAGCTSTFDHHIGSRARYGTPYTEHTDVPSCQEACINEPNCISFDFVTDDTPWNDIYCWLHFDPLEKMAFTDADFYEKVGLECAIN